MRFAYRLLTIAILITFLAAGTLHPASGGVGDVGKSLAAKQITEKAEAGTVSNTGGAGLNFRSSPWGEVMTVLGEGSKLDLLGKDGDWYKVRVGDKTGYVHSDYVTKGDSPAPPAETVAASGSKFVEVDDGSSLNVRSGPWGKILGTLHRGDKVEIVGQNGDWVQIKHDGGTAFVHKDYLADKKPADGGATADPGSVGTGWGGRPTSGPISSPFGYRKDPFGSGSTKFHSGVDYAAAGGSPVKSLGPGKIIRASWNDGYGNCVMIQHDNGLVALYGHLRSYNCSVGQKVGQGQTVGAVNTTGSSTGNHLHYELRRNGTAVNPASIPGVQL